MFKKLFSSFALSVFLIAPGFADELSKTVEVPVAPASAEEAALTKEIILTAAKELCSEVKYVGINSFHRVTARKKCVADAYEGAINQAENTELAAALNQYAMASVTEAALD